MAAEFERQDFISDEALRAPLVMKSNWEEYLVTMKEVRKVGLEFSAAFKGAGSAGSGGMSTKKLKEDTDDLARAQKELTKVSNAMSLAIARDNDEYRKQEQALVKLKSEMKQKNALGEKEALAVNKLNSSLKEIEAALNANRVAYSNLRSEEERNSKTGVTLLKTIQDQKEAASELREEMGQFSGNVGNYTASILKAHKAIQDQEKETKDLIIAQKGLDKSTDEGKKSFDTLKVAIQNNITQINVYRKEAGMAETSTEELNKQLEEGEKKGEGLGDALGKISPGLKSAYDGAVSLGKAFWALVTNPVGLILAAIAAAVAGLARYFTASSEGQDKWNKILGVGKILLDQFLDVLEGVGKALVTMWEEPQKAWQSFMDFLKPVIKIFKDLGEGIVDIFSGDWTKGTDKLEGALEDIKKLAADVWDGAKKAMQDYSDESQRRIAIQNKIDAEAAQLKKDQIQDIIDDSITELKVAKDLQIVHDKLRNTDEKRLDHLREANQLLEEQSKGDVQLAQQELKAFEDNLALEKLSLDTTKLNGEERRKIIDEGIAAGKIDYDNRQKSAELQAKVNKTEQEFLDGQKRRLSEEFAIVNEIAKRKQDQIKAEQTAVQNLNKWRLEDSIDTNDKILQDENSSLGDRIQAVAEIAEAQVQLTENAAARELEAAKNAAKERVVLNDEQLKEIYANKELSLQAQLALDDKYRTEGAAKDQAYITQATEIEKAKLAEITAINEQSAKDAEENVFTVLARDADILQNKLGTKINTALLDLENQFADNEISLADYNKRKLAIQQKGEQESLQSQLDYLTTQAALQAEGSQKQIDFLNQISAVKLQMKENENALQLEAEQKIQDGLSELSTTGVDLAMETINNFFAAEDEARQARLEKIQEQMDAELAAAGDNETAKVAIKNKAALEEQKIRMQQAAAMRKQALFEKTVAVISIAINTAKGIGQALGTYPPPASFVLAAITAVLGALQIAAVVSKPIPSYAVGTKNHAGGLARVGEEGTELITLPSGKSFLSPDESTMMALPARTKVDTHKETMNKLALSSLPHEDRMGSRMDVEMLGVIGSKLDSLEKTVRNKKEQHWNISKQGMQAMVKNAETRQYFMDQLYR